MKKGKRQCRNFGFGAASFFCVFCPRWVARPTTFSPALFPVGDWAFSSFFLLWKLSRQFNVGNFVFVAGDGDVEPLGEEVSAGDRQQAVGGELPYGFVLPGKVFDGQGVGFQRQIVVGDGERRIERASQLASQVVPHDSHLVGRYRFGSEPVYFGEYLGDEGAGKLGARLGGYRQVAAVPHGGDGGGNAIGVAFFFANVRHEPAAEVSAEYGAEVFQGEEVGVLPVYDGQTHANARLQGVLFVGNDDVLVRGLYGVAAGRLRGLPG